MKHPHFFVKKLAWYFNRLRLMTYQEMGHRVKNAIQSRAEQHGLFTVNDIPTPELSGHLNSKLNGKIVVHKKHYLEAADKLLKGHIRIFSLEKSNPGNFPRWNRDPKTGSMAPLRFGNTLDYRNRELVGDIKYLWELNRHLQLMTLAQAYYLSGGRQYLDCLAAQLNSWFDQCPYLMGPNWTSSLELGIRLINWSVVWDLIGGIDCPLFRGPDGRIFLQRWLTSIYQHTYFVQSHFSGYSSANNHLIGEAAGLFIATLTWPFWKEMSKWQEIAYEELVREVQLQNAPDGVNWEQAISYQQFVLDFLIISGLARRANGVEFPPGYWDRIETMLEYIASVMDVGGNVPMTGDADDGYVVKLSQEQDFCPYRSLLATGAVLFKRGDFKKKAGKLDDKTRWLLGEEAEEEFESLDTENAKLPVRRAFLDGGYYILGKDFETDKEIRCIVDCGPLGYLSIAAHGHADALAFSLSIAGREFLIDPGTYAYHTNKKWRDYFRGTSAHNTVRVDGENQSVIGGNFMWTKHAKAVCEVWEPGRDVDRFLGIHEGYKRLPDPVVHQREILLFKSENRVVVKDIVQCRRSHVIERFWHFSEKCNVSVNDSTVIAQNDGVLLGIAPTENEVEIRTLRGEVSPPGGWVSRRYDVKVPTTTVIFRSNILGTTQLETEITLECSSASGRMKV